MTSLLGGLFAFVRGLRVSLLERRAWRAATWISVEGVAKAVTRERLRREYLERPPGNDDLVRRISTSGRFLRGSNIGGRRTA